MRERSPQPQTTPPPPGPPGTITTAHPSNPRLNPSPSRSPFTIPIRSPHTHSFPRRATWSLLGNLNLMDRVERRERDSCTYTHTRVRYTRIRQTRTPARTQHTLGPQSYIGMQPIQLHTPQAMHFHPPQGPPRIGPWIAMSSQPQTVLRSHLVVMPLP